MPGFWPGNLASLNSPAKKGLGKPVARVKVYPARKPRQKSECSVVPKNLKLQFRISGVGKRQFLFCPRSFQLQNPLQTVTMPGLKRKIGRN